MNKTLYVFSTVYFMTFVCQSSAGLPAQDEDIFKKEPSYKSDCGGISVEAARDRLQVWLNRIDLRLRQKPGFESVFNEMRKSLTSKQKIIISVHISQAGALESCDSSDRSDSKELGRKVMKLVRGLAPFDYRPVGLPIRDTLVLVFDQSGLTLGESIRLTTLRNSRIGGLD